MIKAVIFDMDGVLIDSEPVYKKIENEMYKELGVEIPKELLSECMGMVCVEWWKKIIQFFNLDEDPIKWGLIENQRYLNYLEENAGEKMAMKGALELIISLKEAQIKTAIASSSDCFAIDKVCERLGYEPYIDKKISGTQVKKGKPAPDIFLKAAELLALEPKDCLVIEDSTNGIRAALAAGMTCMAYLSAPKEEVDTSGAQYQLKEYKDFYQVLNIL